MEKKIDTETVQFNTYDRKCPFDVARGIMDWLDGIRNYVIRDVAKELLVNQCLNDWGNEVVGAIELFTLGRATNEGIPQKTLDFYKRFDEWCEKNNYDTKTKTFIKNITKQNKKKLL